MAVFLAVAFAQVALVAHDLAHRQVFRTKAPSELAGLIAGNLAIGMSYGWWMDKHTRHHDNPNHDDLDPDVAPEILIWSEEDAAGRRGFKAFVTRHQAYLFFPLLTLLGMSLHQSSIEALRQGAMKRRGLESVLLGAHIVGYLAALLLVLSPLQALVFFVVHQALFGVYLGMTFAPNHKGMPHPTGDEDYLRKQVLTVAQRPRRAVHRRRAGRPELPDRAPPVPGHADAEPAQGPADRAGVLRRDRGVVRGDRTDRLVRPGAAAPARGGRAAAKPWQHAGVKAIIYSETGDPSVLRLVDRDIPEPGPGEVRVRVVVSGVNPTDWKSRPAPEMPFAEVTPNQDGAGVVDAVGPGVQGHAVGDRVWTYLAAAGGRPAQPGIHRDPGGSARPAARRGVSFDVGASLGVPAMTAHRALTVAEDGPRRLEPGALDGQMVLVSGGAGAVGHAAIQLARWAGATVITTISGPAKADLATAAGAQHVVNYREEDPAAVISELAPDGVDLIVEVALGANAELDQAVLSRAPSRATPTTAVTTDPGCPTEHGEEPVGSSCCSTRSATRPSPKRPPTSPRRCEDGVLPVGEEPVCRCTGSRWPTPAAAHQAVEDGAVGKVLIDVADAA